MASNPPVVVTGASGLIAKYTIAEFLRRGFAVRGTVRSMEKAEAVRRAVAKLGCDAGKVSFVVADLGRDDGWKEAVAGSEIVVHTASPFPVSQPDDPEEVIAPARDGTLRVLRAATAGAVARVVLTSSTVAIFYPSGVPKGHIYSEDDVTDETRRDLTPYIRSKTIAERAAWDFTESTPGAPQLAVINPSFVQGPALDGDLSTSHELYRIMARGTYPAVPKISFPVADVRDVAAAHVEAALRPQAAGNRYLIGEGQMSLYALGQIVVRELPDLRAKVPKFELPDFAVRAMALFDKKMLTILPELGERKDYTNVRAKKDLGLEPRSADEAATAATRSLRELRLI
ncbi:NAD-dependent epimerase/dehydratase family protein [Hyphomicrobium sp.]|uniref:NAD-dependent epimerase/dehydratase family protein n=1 Tax=Hyphomicrobium sp. TaxID=82 RepID=UPI002D77B039|nr:NAD-dependent epimerase/dehydratase family protein [Hyphomicrobium sp.]HET6390605.1 NAD-dependent epimerase/dehydratase family protein [Hyphomicrobium sp.]